MDRAHEILRKTLALIKAADADLLSNPSIVSSPQEREVALAVVGLVQGFNYLESPQFKEMCSGKSLSYVAALKRKYLEPTIAKKKKEEFFDSVRNLCESEAVKEFVPAEAHQQIESVRSMLACW